MAKAGPVRVGIIGYGYTGRQLARALQQVENTALIAVSDTDAAKLNLPGVRAFEDYRDLLQDKSIDAVCICLPHALHEEAAAAAIDAGKHLLVEKPLCMSVAAGERVCALAQSARKVLMVEMTHRFLPPLVDAQRMIAAGAIGEIMAVDDVLVEDFGLFGALPEWMLRRDQAGGGFGLTSGIHLLDHVAWLAGQALTLDSATMRYSQGLGDVEDTAAMSLRLENGAPVHILICMRAHGSGLDGTVTIYGSKGTLRVGPWSGWTLEASGRSEQLTYFRPDVPIAERALVGMTGAMREFITAIREKRQPRSAPEDSLISQRLVEQAYCFQTR